MSSRLRLNGKWSLLLVLVGVAACTPTHTVKPLENFVNVGLAPGDKVTVVTHGGESKEFVITAIQGDVLVGEDVRFALATLASIKKHAWSRPESPCGGDAPLGCSVPWLVAIVSEPHGHYKETFYDACAQHDYCYRHGFSSYGLNRDICDENFLHDMLALCPDPATGKVGKIFEAFDDSVESRRTCEQVAADYHDAVRRYGADKFLTTTSSYCEYNGPPARRAPLSLGGGSSQN